MRTLFFLLVLANLAFFAWWRFAAAPDAGGDPLPIGRQIELTLRVAVKTSEIEICRSCAEHGG